MNMKLWPPAACFGIWLSSSWLCHDMTYDADARKLAALSPVRPSAEWCENSSAWYAWNLQLDTTSLACSEAAT